MHKSVADVMGEFVLTKHEFGAQEVVSSIGSAKWVTVVTYNVSMGKSALLDVLKSCEAPVRLVTMIPNRFETYYNADARDRATKAIKSYLDALNPDKFGPLCRVFFCFRNHGKIIATDTVGYVGSANFSDESARNWEAGVIVRDEQKLTAIAGLVDEIISDSVEYFGARMASAAAPLIAARGSLVGLGDCLDSLFDENDVGKFRDAAQSVRDTISNCDRAIGDVDEYIGPIGSRVQMEQLERIEEFLDADTTLELAEANGNLRRALDGDIPADDLPINRDGGIDDAAFHEVIFSAEQVQEGKRQQVEEDLKNVRADVEGLCSEIEAVCQDISEHLGKINNSG